MQDLVLAEKVSYLEYCDLYRSVQFLVGHSRLRVQTRQAGFVAIVEHHGDDCLAPGTLVSVYRPHPD